MILNIGDGQSSHDVLHLNQVMHHHVKSDKKTFGKVRRAGQWLRQAKLSARHAGGCQNHSLELGRRLSRVTRGTTESHILDVLHSMHLHLLVKMSVNQADSAQCSNLHTGGPEVWVRGQNLYSQLRHSHCKLRRHHLLATNQLSDCFHQQDAGQKPGCSLLLGTFRSCRRSRHDILSKDLHP